MINKLESKIKRGPLMSWDISNPILTLATKTLADVEMLNGISMKNNWQVDFVKELSVGYQTLVLTDMNQNIVWVNGGFQSMTGYSPDYAIGKKPAFLQGPNTSEAIKRKIREGLSSGKRSSETITNYKKNGLEYECQLTIIPLVDSHQVITHYLALEREAA